MKATGLHAALALGMEACGQNRSRQTPSGMRGYAGHGEQLLVLAPAASELLFAWLLCTQQRLEGQRAVWRLHLAKKVSSRSLVFCLF